MAVRAARRPRRSKRGPLYRGASPTAPQGALVPLWRCHAPTSLHARASQLALQSSNTFSPVSLQALISASIEGGMVRGVGMCCGG